MNSLELYYNGDYFNVVVDDETYTELINDENKLSTYAKEVYHLINDSARVHDNNARDINLPGPSTCNNVTKEKEPSFKVINEPSTRTVQSISAKENFKWTQSLTLMLIDLRLNKEKEFNRPICKKKKLWEHMATQMTNKSGKSVTSDMCDIKYRNLLNTYKMNKKKSQQSGEGCISWECYQKFDEVLGCKASILPHREVLGDVDSLTGASIVSETDSNSTINRQDVSEPETGENRVPQPHSQLKDIVSKGRNKKSKQSFDIGEYLFNKQKEDREKRLDKEKKEDERWKEKRVLKEREIEAIEKLAEAISKQNKKRLGIFQNIFFNIFL